MHTMDSRGGIKSTLMSLIFTVIITLSTAALNDYHHSEKMLLSDVKALTLRSGQMTNARRSGAVPQLKCVGGAAQYAFSPKVVQCINMGSDGYDIQWECKTDMDNAYRFGSVEVSCEGYDYPNDPFVLKGSCGLEYTLEFTEEGRQGEKQKGGYSYSSISETTSEGGMGGLFVFAGILFAMYVVYKTCINPDPSVPHSGQPQQPPPYGFRPEFSQPPTGPPPPYDGWSTPDSGCAGSAPFTSHHHSARHQRQGRSSEGGGFWSGAATGGILGYMFGSRNSNSYGTGYRSHSPGYTSSTPTGGFFSSSPRRDSSSSNSGSSGTRTASGFGGTSRR